MCSVCTCVFVSLCACVSECRLDSLITHFIHIYCVLNTYKPRLHTVCINSRPFGRKAIAQSTERSKVADIHCGNYVALWDVNPTDTHTHMYTHTHAH